MHRSAASSYSSSQRQSNPRPPMPWNNATMHSEKVWENGRGTPGLPGKTQGKRGKPGPNVERRGNWPFQTPGVPKREAGGWNGGICQDKRAQHRTRGEWQQCRESEDRENRGKRVCNPRFEMPRINKPPFQCCIPMYHDPLRTSRSSPPPPPPHRQSPANTCQDFGGRGGPASARAGHEQRAPGHSVTGLFVQLHAIIRPMSVFPCHICQCSGSVLQSSSGAARHSPRPQGVTGKSTTHRVVPQRNTRPPRAAARSAARRMSGAFRPPGPGVRGADMRSADRPVAPADCPPTPARISADPLAGGCCNRRRLEGNRRRLEGNRRKPQALSGEPNGALTCE